jgi:Cu+-exporting ATPase
MKRKFKVTGMTCSACSAHVQKATEKVDGVREAQVNLLDGSMVVECNENVTDNQIITAVTKAGYGASGYEEQKDGNNSLKLEEKSVFAHS